MDTACKAFQAGVGGPSRRPVGPSLDSLRVQVRSICAPRINASGVIFMITADAVTKRYGRTVAGDGLGFTVQPGRVPGFLGPNGAGKSTTMRLIVGLDAPTSGR